VHTLLKGGSSFLNPFSVQNISRFLKATQKQEIAGTHTSNKLGVFVEIEKVDLSSHFQS
jgi:hypothetical protein